MMMLVASSFVIGALLATKGRVFVLLPTTILGGVVILVPGVFHPIVEICGDVVSYAVSLQFGYLFGAGTHHILIGRDLATGSTFSPH
jgi:hypothetical protein